MGFTTPRLDDRAFDDIVNEARARIPLYTPEWTDHNLSDPGITLIELFAWMTDVVLYRLNRVPDRHYVKFMELLGMQLQQAEPARTMVTFWLSAPQATTMTVPVNTEVSTIRTEVERAIVFATDAALAIDVPQVGFIMTSSGGEERRAFQMYGARSVTTGSEPFPAFASEPPAQNDAFYIGFTNSLSHHIIGVNIEVDTAEGAGIDPNRPPYVWEVLNTGIEQRWEPVEIEFDRTMGLNVSGQVRMYLPEMVRSARNEQTAYWLRCRLDMTDTNSRYNVSPRINQLTVQSWGGSVSATNVTIVRDEVIGRSDGSPGQTFFLVNKPVLTRSSSEYLLVRREDGVEERWQEVADFSNSQPNDRHYAIDSVTGEVRLGPALPLRDGTVQRFGSLPPKGAMLMMTGYRYGGGLVGNVGANTLVQLRTSIPYISRVTNRIGASGGLDAENLETAKLRVPHFLRSLGRAVTAADFEYLAVQAAPGQIGRVYALRPPLTAPGEVKLLVIPSVPRLGGFLVPESLELQDDLREQIISYLDDRRLISTVLDVQQPYYQWVQTEIRIRVTPGENVERVRLAVEAKLFEFVNPLIGGPDGKGWPFGRDMFPADVMAVVLTVPGVSFVRSVRLFPVTYDERRQFTLATEATEIRLPPQGVVTSYQHLIINE
ncbi:MAG: putative baseplate assembly protein [Chloroflexi bacterium]|nr:putative baseplate assembly protein [Chloroflexota bacterium]MBV6437496.1 hypothetical protein [Anaerolineae bacterium]OQY83490.1 MAG: putative baseplate assembly protein [Anaerolineae bacterium UTCFX5]MCC6567220.1 putative baseplate assembly protein [Chloroflexota bacterium]MCO6445838.1 putative baseplate assembly protein [Anaerolineae bacterium]